MTKHFEKIIKDNEKQLFEVIDKFDRHCIKQTFIDRVIDQAVYSDEKLRIYTLFVNHDGLLTCIIDMIYRYKLYTK